jgi:hypothetical protein
MGTEVVGDVVDVEIEGVVIEIVTDVIVCSNVVVGVAIGIGDLRRNTM